MKIARLILFFCFVVCNSCDSILSKFASTIKWIPRHNYDLKTEKEHPKVLSKKVPLVLSIGFNTNWNLRNKPKPERDETYIVEEDAINFLIKGITISGGSGKLFFREANNVLGREFVAGTKVRKGDTTLFYLPSEGDLCAGHKISISAVLLTLDFEREAGVPQLFSLSLASPVFDCHMKKDRDIFYLEDQKRPIDLCITSNNDIANQQHYKLISYEVSGGRGRLLAQNSNKEVYSGLPLFFGVNNLSYFPEGVGSGEHCLRLLIESKETGRQCNLDYTIPVEDHRIEDFTATVSYVHPDDPLLPFRKSEWILFIKPVNKSGKDLTYQVKNLKIGSGILYFEDKVVDTGTTFTGLENKLILDPASHVGDVGIAMTVVNSKGDEREVTFTHAPIIQSPGFNVAHAIDKETISLPLTSPYRHNKYKWALADYFVSRGLKGILVDLHSSLLYKCYPLVAGTKRLGDKTGLVLDPAGHSGDLDVAITAASSKGDERVVQFTHRPVIKKPTFKVSTKIEQEKIFLTIHSDYPHHSDQWSILDYGILGGMQGDLVDLSGNALKQGAPLKVGDTCFSFKVGELTKVTDHPYLYFRVVQPDGSVCDTPNVDLSYFMLDSLSASIAVLGNNAPNFYTPIVKQYTADPVQAIAKRKSLYDTWLEALQHHARLLSHIQEGVVGDQVGSLLAFLKTLEEDTLNRLNERIYFTEVLHGFHHLFVEFACNDNLEERGSLITSMRKKLADFCRDARGKLNNASYLSDVVTELGRLEELVKEEDFTAVMSPCSIESPLLSFKKSKWVLHIQPKNESGAKLKYYVKNFKIRCGSLIFNGKSLDNNVQLSSNNEMLLDAEGHTGDLGITITVVNSQGDERTVTFEKKAEIQHPVFSVNTAIDKGRIMLTLTSSHPNAYDKWSLVDYTVSGGIQGILLDSFENEIRKDTALQADRNYFSLSVDDVLKTKELPCLRLRVRRPDGVIVARSIDLS